MDEASIRRALTVGACLLLCVCGRRSPYRGSHMKPRLQMLPCAAPVDMVYMSSHDAEFFRQNPCRDTSFAASDFQNIHIGKLGASMPRAERHHAITSIIFGIFFWGGPPQVMRRDAPLQSFATTMSGLMGWCRSTAVKYSANITNYINWPVFVAKIGVRPIHRKRPIQAIIAGMIQRHIMYEINLRIRWCYQSIGGPISDQSRVVHPAHSRFSDLPKRSGLVAAFNRAYRGFSHSELVLRCGQGLALLTQRLRPVSYGKFTLRSQDGGSPCLA